MKWWPVVILVLMMVLGAVVPGCRHVPQYDGRLTAADSLMRTNPDSALTILESLYSSPAWGEVARSDGGGGAEPAREALTSDADLAYRDLLLTQARYKCYITATSDSDINRALAYYRTHPADREKLTRAYIYKGAVMEELGHPDSAMLYYKQAEATAAPDDYFNLGYVKMRMGALYRDNHAMDGKHIEKYEEALECLNRTDNKNYQLMCMVNLGSLYCLKKPHKADSLLNVALTLAEQMKDTIKYVGAVQNLIKNDINRDRYDHARGLVKRVMSMDKPKINLPFCLYAARTYACLQMPDSAEYFLKLVKDITITSEMDKISYLEARADIALARGDSSGYQSLRNEYKRKSDSLESVSTPLIIITTEDNVESQSRLMMKVSQQITAHWNAVLVVVVMLALLVAVAVYIILNRRKENMRIQLRRVQQILETSESQLNEMRLSLERLETIVRLNKIKKSSFINFLNSYISLTRDMMEELYHQPSTKYSQKIKEVVKFQNRNKDEWEKLNEYVDMEFNGIISKTKTDFPQLNDKDLMLIALTAMDFSCIQIAIIMGYSNQTSVGTIRKRLCEKMNLTGSLNEYTATFN